MKILFVHEKCGFWGGVEQNIAETARGLRERGHTCLLAYGEATNRETQAFTAAFDETALCREICKQAEGESFASIRDRFAPDVIYLHKAELSAIVADLCGVRTVRMVHDHDLCCPRRHKYYALTGQICRQPMGWRCYLDGAFLAKTAGSLHLVDLEGKQRELRLNLGLDALLVGSRAMREELLINGFSAECVHIVPPVVRSDSRPLVPLPSSPHILFVGQLVTGKGVDLLLRALSRLRCPFTASIAGTGLQEERYKKLCGSLRLQNSVRFTGWVAPDALQKKYDAAKVVVVPSRWPEPFGMIGLEAMHRARPVVGFDVGGIRDWLETGSNGLLVPAQDIESFAAALEQLLTNTPRAAQMGQNGWERARMHFDFNAMLTRLEALLGENANTAMQAAKAA